MRKYTATLLAAVVALAVIGWFYHPSSSAEWAAWIQSAGVLAALLWSLRLQREGSRQSLRQASHVAAMFANNMHWVFRELNDACMKRSWEDYSVHRRILEEVLVQGREVTLQLLDGRSLAMVSSLRSIAVEALEKTVGHTANGNWTPLQVYFDRRLPSIAAWMTATGNRPESSGPTDYAGLRTSFGPMWNS